jgi:hypothetical protein
MRNIAGLHRPKAGVVGFLVLTLGNIPEKEKTSSP